MITFKLKGWQILLVDDDADSINMFAELFRHEGALVDKSQSPVQALQLLKINHYDLLISDVSMPEMNGYDFIKEARRLAPDSKLVAVAMTGRGQLGDEEKTRKAGFDIHLHKPVSIRQIKEALAHYMSSKKSLLDSDKNAAG